MKLKLAIIYGILSWILIHIILIILNSIYPSNILIPISIILVSTLLGIAYIRCFNKNEIKEGFLLGIVFLIINIALNMLFYIINNYLIIKSSLINLPILFLLFPIITTFLGYLANMKIELN